MIRKRSKARLHRKPSQKKTFIHKNILFLGFVGVFVALILGFFMLKISVHGSTPPLYYGFATYLGTNTFASQQTTSTGKQITTLMPWNGKIYMGYGDYGANTGPIHIMFYDPATGQINDSQNASGSAFTSDTESIYNFRAINGALYALAEDPKGSQCGYFYAKTTDGVHWADVKNLQPTPPAANGCPPNTTGDWTDAEHIFDMNTMDGTDLWVAGSSLGKVNVNGTLVQGISGAIWRSTDGGSTWTKMLEVLPTDYATNPNDYTRFYMLGTLNNKMYVQPVDVATGKQQPCKVYDGMSWSGCPNMLVQTIAGGWRPIQFAGKLVYLVQEKPTNTIIDIYDGVTVTQAPIAAQDIAVDDQNQYLYVISGSYIYRTNDLATWERVNIINAPTNGRSIAITGNVLYIGTSDSKLYATSLNLADVLPVGTNVAQYASPTASSQLSSTNDPTKAIDNSTSTEWDSLGETAPWIELDWTGKVTINNIKLFDRPSTSDQVLSGTLTFSDNSTIDVGPIPDDGTMPLDIYFPDKTTDSVIFTVTSSRGTNIGLSEFQASLSNLPTTTPAPTSTPTPPPGCYYVTACIKIACTPSSICPTCGPSLVCPTPTLAITPTPKIVITPTLTYTPTPTPPIQHKPRKISHI